MRRLIALAYGVATHGLFLVGVGAMAWSLWGELRLGFGRLEGSGRVAVNLALLLQFPLLHSWLLGSKGRACLGRAAPSSARSSLGTTLFAAAASLQLLLVFGAWSPGPGPSWQPEGGLLVVWTGAYVASWLLLGKAMLDAGLGIQLGYLGWVALLRGVPPRYGALAEHGLFRRCRQPIYLAFALILWTGPVWNADHLLVALVWSAYCYVGPRFKERRYAARFGRTFDAYRARVPYFLPAFGRSARAR